MKINILSPLCGYFTAALLLPTLVASVSPKPQGSASTTTFVNNPVFWPPSDWYDPRTLYARSLQLSNHSLLITSEIYKPDPMYAPIWRSTDSGVTWSEYSRVYDQVNGWGMRYQPFLYALPVPFGGYPKGTILFAGTSIPANLSEAYIDLYASRDHGLTWEFVSHVAYGSGPEQVQNGAKAIWEAFIMMYSGQLVVFYSDQRDPNHGQKLVHVTTNDLRNFSAPVDDVAMPYYDGRPGMTTVAHIESTDTYIMTFENCGAPVNNCQVNYKLSESPLTFGPKEYHPIASNDSSQTIPYGSPYVIWTPKSQSSNGSGVIIVSGNSESALFVNEDSASVTGWKMVDVGENYGYSRSLRIIDEHGSKKLLLASGGNFGQASTNHVEVGVVDIPQ